MAWGDSCYGYSAYNLAVSLKRFSPSLPICLVHSQEVVKRLPSLTPFDLTIPIEETHDPGANKIRMYDYAPFEHTLYIDVDSLCLQPIEPLFDELIADERWFRIHVFTYYDETSPNTLPEMVWAYREDIWDWFKLSDHKFPATQSSIQYIRKCPEAEEFFKKLRANYDDPLPLEKLRNKWGGTQPDELYYNVTIAQERLSPDIGEKMFFGHRYTKMLEVIEKEYYFLSLFGGRRFTSPRYVRGYDDRIIKNGRATGHPYYKSNYILGGKHANKSSAAHRREQTRLQKKAERMRGNVKAEKMPGKYRLLTSWYQAGSEKRQAELDACLNNNVNLDSINEIVVFTADTEACRQVVQSDKITYVQNTRPTYQDHLDHQWEHYNIIANSDIYFDSTLELVKRCKMDNKVFCLSRYDVNGSKLTLFDAHNGKREYGWSQDSWIWKGKIQVPNLDFHLGLPGCDNKFAYECSQAGLEVANPSRDIKTYHLHTSGVRSYTQEDRLEPPYLPVRIETINRHYKKSLLLKQPGKVGDILICLPIAKYYSKDFVVEWECPVGYHEIFKQIDYVKPVIAGRGNYDKTVDISFGLTRGRTNDWWLKNRDRYNSFITAKYELAAVPLELYRNLEYTRNEENEQALYDHLILPAMRESGYSLVHNSSNDGTQVNVETDLPRVDFAPVEGYSIFDWRKIIENAKEIHCIDSSLLNFVETVPTKAKLIYHHAPRNEHDWNNALKKCNWHTSPQVTH